jgi:hypothetical protein
VTVPASGIASRSPMKRFWTAGGMDRPSIYKLHIMRLHIYKYVYISFVCVLNFELPGQFKKNNLPRTL